jgi:hypothetical protein
MTGSPATGNRGLGTLKDSGRNRVPRDGPPIRITALTDGVLDAPTPAVVAAMVPMWPRMEMRDDGDVGRRAQSAGPGGGARPEGHGALPVRAVSASAADALAADWLRLFDGWGRAPDGPEASLREVPVACSRHHTVLLSLTVLVCVCLFLSLSLCVCLSLSLSLSVSVSLSLSV